jgi:hypothetical protein
MDHASTFTMFHHHQRLRLLRLLLLLLLRLLVQQCATPLRLLPAEHISWAHCAEITRSLVLALP